MQTKQHTSPCADCYDTLDYRWEADTVYYPTPQQIDAGTDRDEVIHYAVCNICDHDMEHIDQSEYYNQLADEMADMEYERSRDNE